MIPKISIITPSYNQGSYIEDTILSVLNQNYPNLEYIIIDGGSNDSSVEVIKKYEEHLSYWVSEKDNGQSHAINKGFQRATGDIVAWINSDDVYVDNIFEFVSNYFINHPDVDMIYGNAEIIDKNGKTIMHRKEIPFDKVMGCFWGFGLLIPQPAAFWRRSIFEKIGYLDENLHFGMDSDLWRRIAVNGYTIKHVDKLFAKMRYHQDAKTITNYKQNNEKNMNELSREIRLSYNTLKISKFVPYEYSLFIRRMYRLKRIILRFIFGHYFKNYKSLRKLKNLEY